MKENTRKVNSRGEQDRRREKPDDDETPRNDEEVCREGLPWVEDGRRGNPRGNLWSCLAIDERKVLLDVVDSWDEMMEPKGFAMPNPPRTSRSSCSRLNFLCSCSCTAETHLICPCSHLQGRRTWLQFRCVTLARTRCNSAAFPHQLRRHPNRPTTAAGRTLPLYTCGRASPNQPGSPPSLSRATLALSASPRTEARSHRGHLHNLRE
jgi:hypothetical protein